MRKLLIITILTFLWSGFALSGADQVLTINAVGDIMMGTLYPSQILPPKNGKEIFKDVKAYLQEGNPDLVMGNLEGALCEYPRTEKRVKAGRSYAFRMPPHYAPYLKDAGFNILSHANNHSYDFGYKGALETRKYIQAAGMRIFGDKNEILYIEQKGVRIGLIAFSWLDCHNSVLNPKAAQALIKKAKETSDFVIISMHAGSEGSSALHVENKMEYLFGNPRGNLVAFTHQAIDAGADLILGHGPHVPRAMELYKNRLIAYSLGNFLTYTMSTAGYKKVSLVLQVKVTPKGEFISGKILPIIQHEGGSLNGIPYYDEKGTAIKLIRELSKQDIKNNQLEITAEGILQRK